VLSQRNEFSIFCRTLVEIIDTISLLYYIIQNKKISEKPLNSKHNPVLNIEIENIIEQEKYNEL